MRYIPVTCEQRQQMLVAVGVDSVDALFEDVPAEARLTRPLALDEGLSEIDLVAHLKRLAARNWSSSRLVCFAGAGCYDHYVPSVVDHVLRRPEFFTAYTPYQPEVSQGTLQAIFEYQTMICELTGMDASNASMYDGATAFVEAAFMAARLTKKKRVVVAGSVHPEWLDVLATYASSERIEIDVVDFGGGRMQPADVEKAVEGAAALMVQSPNFLGVLEDLEWLGHAAREAGALFVVASNPIMLGLIQPPAAFGADIVVGEGQPLGNGMNYGGPGLGFFACKQSHIRQMPGRLVGRTVDADGNTAYVLTLSTREQHIRREKATSNICSNHALNALAAGVYLSAVGTKGLEDIAIDCVTKAHYMRDELVATGKFSVPWDDPFGYEFALIYHGDMEAMHRGMLEKGFLPGVVLTTADEDQDMVLFAVTEKRTRAEIDTFVKEVAAL